MPNYSEQLFPSLSEFLGRLRKKVEMKRDSGMLLKCLKIWAEKNDGDVQYWDNRYKDGWDSGPGSKGVMAEFKAKVVNNFIQENKIVTVTEFGCGDGEQLKLMRYSKYFGLDVSAESIVKCKNIYRNDQTKKFYLYCPYNFKKISNLIRSEATVCLDVLYHITSHKMLLRTISDLLLCAKRFVIIYTIVDIDRMSKKSCAAHIKYIDPLKILNVFSEFEMYCKVPNKYPELSAADFIILKRKNA